MNPKRRPDSGGAGENAPRALGGAMHTTLVLDVESADDSTLTVEMTLEYKVEAVNPGDLWNPPSGGQVYGLEVTIDGVTDMPATP